MRSWLLLGSLPLLASAQHAYAQSSAQYVVVKGDTCPIVAKKVYGDEGHIEELHEANPQLGAVPHTLVPGQVLNTPKLKAPAKVTFIRKDVVAATPAPHPAKVNEDLERGHKVSTLANSSAELTFKDTTRLQLSDHTLVVVLGGTSSHASSKQATPADTTLMTGELRVHLGTLVGKPKSISTPSASSDIGGESKLSVDDKSATRLAVYKGKSTIAAGGAKVNVDGGYGSKAELGKKPTKPRPLPAAPIWSTPLPQAVIALGDAAVASAYAPGEGGPKAETFHVQLSRDAEFNDLVVDVRVPNDVTRFEAKALGPGRYFARVSAIDSDLFEGPFGTVARFGVIRASATPASPGKRAALSVDSGALGAVLCGLDGAAAAPVTGPIEFAPGHAHVLRCAAADAPGETADLSVGAEAGGPLSFVDSIGDARVVAGVVEQEVRLTVRDAAGAPVRNAKITTTAPPGVTVAPLREIADGVYVALVRRKESSTGAVVFEIVGAAKHSLPLAVIDEGGAPGTPSSATARPYELALFIGAVQARGPRPLGGAIGIDAMARKPLGSAILGIGLRGAYERYGLSEDAHRGNAFALAAPITLGLAGSYRPYVAFAPQVVFARLRDEDGRILPRAPGLGGQLGIGLRVGGDTYGAQLEAGYRLLFPRTDADLSGVYVALSGRLGL